MTPSRPTPVVRQVSGGTGRDRDDRFRIVSERQLDAESTAYAFIESEDLTEAEVCDRLERAGSTTVESTRALRAAREIFTRPFVVTTLVTIAVLLAALSALALSS